MTEKALLAVLDLHHKGSNGRCVMDNQWPCPTREAVESTVEQAAAERQRAAHWTLFYAADYIQRNHDHIPESGGDGYSAGFHYALTCIRDLATSEPITWERAQP